MTAPEGSHARISARQLLHALTDRAIKQGISADEWMETVARNMPRELADVGERDMRAIIAVVLGRRRQR